jgi:hypothetical protein
LGAGSGVGFLSFTGLAIKTSLLLVFVSLLATLHIEQAGHQTHAEIS